MSDGIEALKRAVEVLNTQVAVAKILEVTPQAISEAIRNGKSVPAHWCQPLDRATAALGRRVSCHELLPDIFPKDFTPPALDKVKTSKGRKRLAAGQRQALA